MGTRLGRWINFIEESHWRFGLVLAAICTLQIALMSVTFLTIGPH